MNHELFWSGTVNGYHMRVLQDDGGQFVFRILNYPPAGYTSGLFASVDEAKDAGATLCRAMTFGKREQPND